MGIGMTISRGLDQRYHEFYPYHYPRVLCFRLLNIGLRDRLLCPLLPSDTTSEIDCGSEAFDAAMVKCRKEMVCGHVGLVIGPRQLQTTPHWQPSFPHLDRTPKIL
jgi:hypothetical protein